jgi:hypothetical protein
MSNYSNPTNNPDVNGKGISPSVLANWQRNRPYTKLWGEVATRVAMSRLSWRTKGLYLGIQPILGQTEIPGILIKRGEPMSLKTLSLQLNVTAGTLTQALNELVEFGVLDKHPVTECFFDSRIVADELVSQWESERKKEGFNQGTWQNMLSIATTLQYLSATESTKPLWESHGKTVVQDKSESERANKASEATNLDKHPSPTAPACRAVAAVPDSEYENMTESEFEEEAAQRAAREKARAEREARQKEIDAQIDRDMAKIEAELEAKREAKRQAMEAERKAQADREVLFRADANKLVNCPAIDEPSDIEGMQTNLGLSGKFPWRDIINRARGLGNLIGNPAVGFIGANEWNKLPEDERERYARKAGALPF